MVQGEVIINTHTALGFLSVLERLTEIRSVKEIKIPEGDDILVVVESPDDGGLMELCTELGSLPHVFSTSSRMLRQA